MFYSALLAVVAAASYLPQTALAEPKVVGIDFDKALGSSQVAGLTRRADVVPVTMQNFKYLYTLNLTVGTPPQRMRVLIDTGSSDLWVPSVGADMCMENKAECKANGACEFPNIKTFMPRINLDGPDDASASKTSVNTHDYFEANYADESRYVGIYYKDTVGFKGVSMDDVQFGLARKTENVVINDGETDTVGLMGLGFEQSEFSIDNGGKQYLNVMGELKKQGFVKTKSFSLYLNSFDAPTGTLLFGGLDNSKYKGPLIAAPMVPRPGDEKVSAYAIECTSITASSPAGNTSLMPSNSTNVVYALLDSGAAHSSIPPHLIPALHSYLGAKTDPNMYNALVPCNLSTADATFTFGFGGPKGPQITVPISDFIAPRSEHPDLAFEDGTPACELTIGSSGDTEMSLGDSFLHSAYAVYDIENQAIALAQSNLAPKGDPQIVEITPGDGIPGVKTVVKEIDFDEEELEAQASAISASAATASSLPEQTNFSYGTVSEVPGTASVTAQGAATTSEARETADRTKARRPESTTAQSGTPTPTGGAVSLKGRGGVTSLAVLVGALCWV